MGTSSQSRVKNVFIILSKINLPRYDLVDWAHGYIVTCDWLMRLEWFYLIGSRNLRLLAGITYFPEVFITFKNVILFLIL